ncbi:MAG: hypothetical protein P1U32_06515 [Legionellaceae bacterium]|nr:hypothetical protein [Legionellaceae bacterium]
MRKRVLWGHHVSDYQEMFDLSDKMLTQTVLEYGCGASAVNAELHAKQCTKMVSVDPLFGPPKSELAAEITQCFDERVAQVLSDPSQFNVDGYGGMDAFLSYRRKGMDLFLEDYEKGLSEGRYKAMPSDATLPFDDFAFDLALSSHYLFAASNEQSVDFHLQAIRELARVAKEARIFPLIEREGTPSELIGPVLLGLQQANFGAEVREVSCALYPEGNAMLRVWALACDV